MRTFISRSVFFVAIVALINAVFPSLIVAQPVFKVEATGYEYCNENEKRTTLNANNNVDLWIKILPPFFPNDITEDPTTQSTLSLTPNFAPGTTFYLPIRIFNTARTATSLTFNFIALYVNLDNGVWLSIQGTERFNSSLGELVLTSFSGTFQQTGVFQADDGTTNANPNYPYHLRCFTTGKFTSKRVN